MNNPDTPPPELGTPEQKLAIFIAALHPGWNTDDIRRALQADTVRTRPLPEQAIAAILCATDPTTDSPGRLRLTHLPHWTLAARACGRTPTPAGYSAPPLQDLDDAARARRDAARAQAIAIANHTAASDLMEHPDPIETSDGRQRAALQGGKP